MGVQILSHHLGPYPSETTTVMSQLGTAVFGGGTVLYVVLQFATAAILTLAANTAYADFPRLSSIIARDGYLPRQLANRGDRLVFSNGVIVLAAAAGALIIAFGGKTNALIPLYAVGVFLSFTLSQAGMVRHHQKEREKGYKRNIVINAVGVGGHAHRAADRRDHEVHERRVGAADRHPDHRAAVQVDQAALPNRGGRAARHARLQAPADEPHRRRARRRTCTGECSRRWPTHGRCTPTTCSRCRSSPTRRSRRGSSSSGSSTASTSSSSSCTRPTASSRRPIMTFVDELDARYENDIITVVLPEFVVRHWWANVLHNQNALLLKGRLLFRKGTVVTSVPYHLD